MLRNIFTVLTPMATHTILLLIAHFFVHQVLLSFDAFNTEYNYDFVSVYDGSDTSAPLLGSFTGPEIPANIRSNGHSMTVRMISDDSESREGFSATVTYMGKL